MIRLLKGLLTLGTAAAIFGAASPPATAAKEPACWKVLLNDWYDGTIDGSYSLRCYRDLLDRLQGDTFVQGYTSALDDINRAYQQRRSQLASGPALDQSEKFGGDPATPRRPGGGSATDTRLVGHDRWYPALRGGNDPAPRPSGFSTVLRDGATSIPIPLIVLAGIAVLLMAAGAATLIARRTQGKK
jgi:hypothetical protein